MKGELYGREFRCHQTDEVAFQKTEKLPIRIRTPNEPLEQSEPERTAAHLTRASAIGPAAGTRPINMQDRHNGDMIPFMRVYKFLNKQFGLKGLYERRLKQSRIHELNDPFELAPYDLTDPAVRHAFVSVREFLGRENGLICFSASWQNPVIWAHYADKHQGICLGFEIPPITGNGEKDIAKKVTYISRPLRFPAEFLSLPQARQLKYVNRIPFTKFNHWAYEKEIRVWGRLSNEEDGLHFFEFEHRMRLVEVRVGASCTLPRTAIMRTLGASPRETAIIKVRAAHNRFAMVQDDEW